MAKSLKGGTGRLPDTSNCHLFLHFIRFNQKGGIVEKIRKELEEMKLERK
ncbi:MAG: hypothetical protein AABZ02_09930 [Bacteroidota bacterium]